LYNFSKLFTILWLILAIPSIKKEINKFNLVILILINKLNY
jgi:hypothetical protein